MPQDDRSAAIIATGRHPAVEPLSVESIADIARRRMPDEVRDAIAEGRALAARFRRPRE